MLLKRCAACVIHAGNLLACVNVAGLLGRMQRPLRLDGVHGRKPQTVAAACSTQRSDSLDLLVLVVRCYLATCYNM